MSDALDYHYGVPLYLLNHSFLPNQDIWLHGSLFGYGELMSAIGYISKLIIFLLFSDIKFNFIFEFLVKKEKDQNRLLFVLFFIISAPVILFLISDQNLYFFPNF